MLRWRDVTLFADHLILVIQTSKTDQFSDHPHRIVLNLSPGSRLCPVFWLSEIARVFKPLGPQPLFCLPSPEGLTPILSTWFNQRLKDLASCAGLDPSVISSHSLRHGGASFMLALGCDIIDIRARGSWASSAILRYLHHSDSSLRSKDLLVSSRFY